MTLLIACMVIYGLDLSPWLYAVAVVVWLMGANGDSANSDLVKETNRRTQAILSAIDSLRR